VNSNQGTLWTRISALNEKLKLIVWGMKDIAFREKELRRWERAFLEVRKVRLLSVGHFVQEEAPEELAEAVVIFLGDRKGTTADCRRCCSISSRNAAEQDR